jgi:hypothetical protein
MFKFFIFYLKRPHPQNMMSTLISFRHGGAGDWAQLTDRFESFLEVRLYSLHATSGSIQTHGEVQTKPVFPVQTHEEVQTKPALPVQTQKFTT